MIRGYHLVEDHVQAKALLMGRKTKPEEEMFVGPTPLEWDVDEHRIEERLDATLRNHAPSCDLCVLVLLQLALSAVKSRNTTPLPQGKF